MHNLIIIFIAAVLTHNIALTYLLGMCPMLAMSKNIKLAYGMGISVLIVMTITSSINWLIFNLILKKLETTSVSYLVYIIVIAGTVQILEMFIEKFFPKFENSFGIFLPLITVNCTILAISLFMELRHYSFLENIFFSFGSGLGWLLCIVIIASIREKMKLVSDIPKGLKGAGITMIVAGILALSFMGFSGMVNIQ